MERGWTNHGHQVNQHNKPGSPVNSAQEAILREKNKRVNASGVHSVQAMERLSYTIACIISMTGAAASITNGLHQFLTIHDIYHGHSMIEIYPAYDTRTLTQKAAGMRDSRRPNNGLWGPAQMTYLYMYFMS